MNFFARSNTSHKISKLKVLKLIYLADRYHLRKYGRMITNDNYFAMRMGPVASSVKNIAEQSTMLSKDALEYGGKVLHKVDHEHNVRSQSEVNEKVFSQTDLEALNFVKENFMRTSPFELVDKTHLFPEWNKHENLFKHNPDTTKEMDIIDFFLKAPEEHEYCDLDDELLELNKEFFVEQLAMEQQLLR